MTIVMFPDSLNPVTLRHMDIAVCAHTLVDKVTLAVGFNASKRYTLDPVQRLAMVEAAVEGPDGMHVVALPGLLTDLCKEPGADVIVKGLWGEADFSTEKPMALMNRSLTGIEAVLVLGDPALTHIAFPLVKGVTRHGRDVTDLVSPGVAEALAGIHHIEEQQRFHSTPPPSSIFSIG